MKKLVGCVAVMLLAVACSNVSAAEPSGYVGVHASFGSLDVDGGDDDFEGFGLSGQWAPAHGVILRGDYDTTEGDDSNLDLDILRLGAGLSGAFGPSTIAYVALDYTRLTMDGFGGSENQNGATALVGLNSQQGSLTFLADAGYVLLDDLDGPYVNGEIVFTGLRPVGLFGGYRYYMLEADGVDFDYSQLRVGVRYLF